ncbi:bacteriocin [Flavobacterium circumlabens]|uniref:Bacteriocin n=1 Tax=Flavobacterium circumlabens TaxID=2133765 RepID=A0A4Y7UG52_9FLAO|nr:bacteriocin [Flavobacterium circumlabens]
MRAEKFKTLNNKKLAKINPCRK